MGRIQRELFNQQDIGYQQFMSKCIPDAYLKKIVLVHLLLFM